MNKKILTGLVILGMVFVGSATYALFNENPILDVVPDVQTSEASLPNEHPNIQNNQQTIIASNGNSNLSFNNMANIVLTNAGGINDNSFPNNNETHSNKEIVKLETRRDPGNSLLEIVDDTSALDGGYVTCADCGNFIPVGNVFGQIDENYLCHCPDEHPTSVKDVPFVYTEESVLNDISFFNKEMNFHNIENTDSYIDSSENV